MRAFDLLFIQHLSELNVETRIDGRSTPMRRKIAEPRDPRVAERGVGVETPGDDTGDERPALLRQQAEHPFLRRDQPVDPRRLAIEVVGDGALLEERMDMD